MTLAGGSLVARYGPWAVVTGASSGIGREYARFLASQGFGLVLVARRRALLDELAAELQAAHHCGARAVPADLSDPASVDVIAAAVADLDIGLLVNNAGAAQYGSFFRDPAVLHVAVLNVNVVSPIALTRVLGGPMKERGRGGVIFTSSTAAALIPYFATYAASKSCISNFAQLLEFEMRPFGVNVLCVEPGFVETEMGLLLVKDVDLRKLTPCTQPMPAADVARLSLKQLGVVAVFTPGPMSRLSKMVTKMLPTKLRFHLLGSQIRGVMSSKLQVGLRPT